MFCENGLVFKLEDDKQRAERLGRMLLGLVPGLTEFQEITLVHRGFARAYLSVREQLLEAHAALCAEIKPSAVLVTGHSLGGALATLFTLELLALGLHQPSEV